jgi:arylsulfatase A
MNHKLGAIFFALVFLLSALTSVTPAQPHQDAAQKPNVVIILADDFGYGSTNAYGADLRLARTPNLDRLAKKGRRFTDAKMTRRNPLKLPRAQ